MRASIQSIFLLPCLEPVSTNGQLSGVRINGKKGAHRCADKSFVVVSGEPFRNKLRRFQSQLAVAERESLLWNDALLAPVTFTHVCGVKRRQEKMAVVVRIEKV